MGQVVYEFDDEIENTDASRRYGLRGRGMEHGGVNVLMGRRCAAAPLWVTVTVSFHPVTTDDDETPRFVAGPTKMVFEVERVRHVSAVPVRDQHVRLRYRNRRYEYFVGSRHLHHRIHRH